MAIVPIPNKHVDIRHYTMTAGQTFSAGNAVVLAAAGTVSTAGDDPGTDGILGFALSGYGGGLEVDPYAGKIPVAVAKSNSTFILEADTDVAATNVGESFGVNNAAGVCCSLDVGDTSATCLLIEAIIADSDDGHPSNMVEVSIHGDTLQFGGP